MTEAKPVAKPVTKTIRKSVTEDTIIKETVPEQKAQIKEPSLIDLINHQKGTESVLDRERVISVEKHKPITPVNLKANG